MDAWFQLIRDCPKSLLDRASIGKVPTCALYGELNPTAAVGHGGRWWCPAQAMARANENGQGQRRAERDMGKKRSTRRVEYAALRGFSGQLPPVLVWCLRNCGSRPERCLVAVCRFAFPGLWDCAGGAYGRTTGARGQPSGEQTSTGHAPPVRVSERGGSLFESGQRVHATQDRGGPEGLQNGRQTNRDRARGGGECIVLSHRPSYIASCSPLHLRQASTLSPPPPSLSPPPPHCESPLPSV